MGVRKMKELFVKEYGADPKFLNDIGMENKVWSILNMFLKNL